MSGYKGGRKSARKARRAARSKPNTLASAPASTLRMLRRIQRENELFEKKLEVMGMTVLIDGMARPIWRDDFERLHAALRDAIHFYDRATGAVRGDGWTPAETRRLAELRALAYRTPIPGVPAPVAGKSPGDAVAGPETPENRP